VQHALRAFTPDDEKNLRAASRTFPRTEYYDVQQVLTTLGIGEAMVVTLQANGAPTLPFISRMIPPQSRMGPLTEAELAQRLATPQVKKYATAVDRESAREMLAARVVDVPDDQAEAPKAKPKEDGGGFLGGILDSSIAKSVVRTAAVAITGRLVRGMMGSLLPSPRRRTRRR
jgi:hypothetical protein